MQRFMETADVARELGVVPATVRLAVTFGHLRVAAKTERGTSLFRRQDFEVYLENRKKRGLERRGSGR